MRSARRAVLVQMSLEVWLGLCRCSGMQQADLLGGNANQNFAIINLDQGHTAAWPQALIVQNLDALLAFAFQQPASAGDPGCCQNQAYDQQQAKHDSDELGLFHRLAAAVQTLDAIRWRHDVGHADTVFIVYNNHFALGNQVAVHVNIQWFTGQAVQFHD